MFPFLTGLQPTKTGAELDSSTVLKQIFYEYHPLILPPKAAVNRGFTVYTFDENYDYLHVYCIGIRDMK